MVFVDKQNKAMKEGFFFFFFGIFFWRETKEELQITLFALMTRKGGYIFQMLELLQQWEYTIEYVRF